ncbi:MAG: sulfotransferase domain-containing protein [Gammaproteobacteria bacterium]|nr:sulfotransferase domain-containing protein [Gammaproteobacteria bacterium]
MLIEMKSSTQIIYVSRNPKDTAGSFYHFHKMARYLGMQTTAWDEFFPLFTVGKGDSHQSWGARQRSPHLWGG